MTVLRRAEAAVPKSFLPTLFSAEERFGGAVIFGLPTFTAGLGVTFTLRLVGLALSGLLFLDFLVVVLLLVGGNDLGGASKATACRFTVHASGDFDPIKSCMSTIANPSSELKKGTIDAYQVRTVLPIGATPQFLCAALSAD